MIAKDPKVLTMLAGVDADLVFYQMQPAFLADARFSVASISTSWVDFEKNLSLEKTLEVSLYNVNKAIKKIEEGNYGLCEKCSQPIDPKRLEAFPSATSCMACKQKSL